MQQGKPTVTQEWSVHAEVVFSHGSQPRRPGAGDVRMEYSWQNPVPGAATVVRPSYGFQRGNILFTSTPPQRQEAGNVVYGSLPLRRSPQQPYNRRCKSTCSIVLSDARQQHSHTVRCSDPGCYHSEASSRVFCPPVPESCEVCVGGRSPTSARRATAANTFTTHFCTRVPEKQAQQKQHQDAASQTDFGNGQGSRYLRVPEIDAFPKKPGKRLSRSPARLRGKSPLLQGKKSQASQCSDSRGSSLEPDETLRKPRTVHIDVYCTGSEASVSSEADTTEESSPQTVYESEQFRVVHTKVGKERLPKALLKSFKKSESFKYARGKVTRSSKGYDSDDGLSSLYPSKMTSYDSLAKSDTPVPDRCSSESRDPSWSSISSSCALLDDCDSISTTWKDTVTEPGSPGVSSSSITDSVDLNLAQSDSFEYADTSDRLRIREKELSWGEGNKTWRSPNTERKFLMQKQKYNDFIQHYRSKDSISFPNTTDSDDDDDDDSTGDAWSFVRATSPKAPLKRESTVRKAAVSRPQDKNLTDIKAHTLPSSSNSRRICDTGSLSDSGTPCVRKFAHRAVIGPFGQRPPSPPLSKVESSITAPFTTPLGTGTDHLSKAQRFGAIVGTLKKPGHHVGPSKNPDCTCVHCLKFYEDRFHRGRARSVGEVPSGSGVGKMFGTSLKEETVEFLNIPLENVETGVDCGNGTPV